MPRPSRHGERYVAPALLLLVLSACNGGGASSSAGTPTTTLPKQVTRGTFDYVLTRRDCQDTFDDTCTDTSTIHETGSFDLPGSTVAIDRRMTRSNGEEVGLPHTRWLRLPRGQRYLQVEADTDRCWVVAPALMTEPTEEVVMSAIHMLRSARGREQATVSGLDAIRMLGIPSPLDASYGITAKARAELASAQVPVTIRRGTTAGAARLNLSGDEVAAALSQPGHGLTPATPFVYDANATFTVSDAGHAPRVEAPLPAQIRPTDAPLELHLLSEQLIRSGRLAARPGS